MKFKAGQEILRSVPYAAAIHTGMLDRACSHCLTCKSRMFSCAQCRVVYYCSDDCQDADSTAHRTECDELRRCAPWVPGSDVRLLCRVWLRMSREKKCPSKENVLGSTRTIDSLLTHRRSRSPEVVQKILNQIGSQVKLFLSGRDCPDDESLLTAFMKLDINCHHVVSWDGPLGCALYLGGSIVDHSCNPDGRMTYFFDDGHFVVRAIKDLEIGGFNDVRISYVPFILPRQLRRSKLEERYFFECTCPRCSGQIPETVVHEGGDQLIEEIQQLQELPNKKMKLSRMMELSTSPELQRLRDNDYAKLSLSAALFALYGTLARYTEAVDLGLKLLTIYEPMDVGFVHRVYLTCQIFSAALNAGWFDRNHPEHSTFLSLLRQAGEGTQEAFGPNHYHSKLVASIRNSFPNAV